MKVVKTVNPNNKVSLPWLNKVILQQSTYFNDEFFDFVLADSGGVEFQRCKEQASNKLIAVVSRKHYAELVRIYPVEKASELAKLINLEFEGQRVHYLVVKLDNGKSTVNLWHFHDTAPTNMLLLPETLLLSKLVLPGQTMVLENTSRCFVSSVAGVVHSQLSSPLINSSSAFAMSVGSLKEADDVVVTTEQHADALSRGIQQLDYRQLFRFFSAPKQQTVLQKIRPLMLPVVAAFTLYLLGTSVYLYSYKSYLQSQGIESRDSLNQALSLEERLHSLEEKYTGLAQFHSQQPNVSGVWSVLLDVYEKARFNSINFSQGRFILNGSADKATDVLALLTSNEHVAGAKFDNPTRRNRGRELFVISFTLHNVQNQDTVPLSEGK